MSDLYQDEVFEAGEYLEFFTEAVAKYCQLDASAKFLDVGCGDGALIFLLADTNSSASFVGADISFENIALADRRLSMRTGPANIEFVCEDFLGNQQKQSFEYIFSYSVFHLIQADMIDLIARVSAQLAPGGRFLLGTPYGCVYNSGLTFAKRALRRIRTPLLDRFAMAGAKLVYGRSRSDEFLGQRLIYLYQPSSNFYRSEDRESILNRFGMKLLAEDSIPSPTFIQERHKLLVFEKLSC